MNISLGYAALQDAPEGSTLWARRAECELGGNAKMSRVFWSFVTLPVTPPSPAFSSTFGSLFVSFSFKPLTSLKFISSFRMRMMYSGLYHVPCFSRVHLLHYISACSLHRCDVETRHPESHDAGNGRNSAARIILNQMCWPSQQLLSTLHNFPPGDFNKHSSLLSQELQICVYCR